MCHYFYDSDRVRYELYQSNGGSSHNWLFFPGGPGADSRYFRSLVDELELSGNVWLIDFPGNGDNLEEGVTFDFEKWLTLFPRVVKKFSNSVLVGHSFGGMLPLIFPEMERVLRGLVILNSAPSLWLEEAAAYSKQFDLPDLSEEMEDFTLNPNQATFERALDACMPYYFPPHTLDRGRQLLSQVPFHYPAAGWWQNRVIESHFSATWIPQTVPTLIVGSKYDCICPFSLFQNDGRFQRPNIRLHFIEDAGHLVWIENPQAIREAFDDFIRQLATLRKER